MPTDDIGVTPAEQELFRRVGVTTVTPTTPAPSVVRSTTPAERQAFRRVGVDIPEPTTTTPTPEPAREPTPELITKPPLTRRLAIPPPPTEAETIERLKMVGVKVTKPFELATRQLLAVDLPTGAREISAGGVWSVKDPDGGTRYFAKTMDGYLQTNIQGQPVVPKSPSKELRVALTAYSALKGKKQFKKAVEIGLIPRGNVYVPGETPEVWSYIDVSSARELHKESPELYEILTTKGWKDYEVAYDKMVREFEKEQKIFEKQRIVSQAEYDAWLAAKNKLIDAGYEVKRLSDEEIKVGIQDYKKWSGEVIGEEEFRQAIKDVKGIDIIAALRGVKEEKIKVAPLNRYFGEETVNRYQTAIDAMGDLDLMEARQALVDRKHLVLLFGEKNVKDTEDWMRDQKIVFPSYLSVPKGESLMPGVGVFNVTKEGRQFAEKYPDFVAEVARLMRGGSIMDLSEHYGRWNDAWYDVNEKLSKDKMPSQNDYMRNLRQQISAYTKYIDDLPKDSPEVKAFTKTLTRRGIKYATYLALLATPYSIAGIAGMGAKAAVWSANLARGIPFLGKVLTTSMPLIGSAAVAVPRMATGLAYLGIVGGTAGGAAAHITESIRATDLSRKWDIFSALSETDKNVWAKRSGYTNWSGLTEAQQANVLLHYIVPVGYTPKEWGMAVQKVQESLLEHADKGAEWLDEHAPAWVSKPIQFVGGAALVGTTEGVGYMGQMMLLPSAILDEVPEGRADDYAKDIAMGMAQFFTVGIPAAVVANPWLGTGRMIGLFLLSPMSVAKLGKGLGLRTFRGNKFLANRAIQFEYAAVQVARKAITPKAMKGALTKLMKQLMAGKRVAKVKVEGIEIKVRNIAYQQVAKNTVFHATPDITPYLTGKPFKIGAKGLYFTYAAAQRFMNSTAFGKTGKHPGIVAVTMSPSKIRVVQKLISKGKVGELETKLDGTLDPVGGSKGINYSYNLQTGSYPVVHFTLRGSGMTFKGLTKMQVTRMNLMALKEGALDMALGWHWRMKVLKDMVSTTPKVERIEKAIRQLKNEIPETVGKYGEITRQRQPVPHPSGSGVMNSRVTGVIRNPKTNGILLVMDKIEHAFGLPGGRIELRWWRQRPKHGHTWESAISNQLDSEVNFTAHKYESLGLYKGKINDYALSGSRVFDAVAKSTKIDPKMATRRTQPRGSKPEIQSAFWWDGKSEVTVYPATFDILKAVSKKYGLDMSKVHIYKGSSKVLLKARDKGFANRVKKGEKISESDIKAMNEVELKALMKQRGEALAGETPSLLEWMKAENDLNIISDLVFSRRSALTLKSGAKVKWKTIKSLDALESAISHLTGKEIEALRGSIDTLIIELNKNVIAKKGLSVKGEQAAKNLAKNINELLKQKEGAIKEILEPAYDRAYRENRGYYDKYYGTLLDRAYRIVRGVYRKPVTRAELGRRYVSSLREYNPIAYEPIQGRIQLPREKPAPRLTYRQAWGRKEYIPRKAPVREIPRRVIIPRKDIPRKEIPRKEIPKKPPPRVPERPPRVPETLPPPLVVPSLVAKDEKKIKGLPLVTWYQGSLKIRGKLREQWYVVKPPYKTSRDIYRQFSKPIGAEVVKGVGAAYKTIQKIGVGDPNILLRMDMGAMDLIVRTPKVRGEKGAIRFKRDVRQETVLPISAKEIRTVKT